ncbi:MAG: amino acid permease [Coriobacteriales bacterium]|jgi:D-serine/D-alanine/glycine transporter|nr:amino acid permease [Coriobacteriales bacterium]
MRSSENRPQAAATSGRHLVRELENRHIQLIAIGGAIGSFLFVGSAQVIVDTGPSALLIYLIAGVTFFFGMRALGELLLSNLHYKSFRDAIDDILGPRAGFTVGWMYTMVWVLICVADSTAVATYVQYWWPGVPTVVVSVAMLALVTIINLIAVRAFGEFEFWFALIKVVAIVLIAVVGLFLIFTGFQVQAGVHPNILNLWSNGGLTCGFSHGASGFFRAFQLAFLAYGGVELVGTTSAEAKDPEKTLPKAVNALPLRISLFYIVPLAIILIVAPWFLFVPGKSPFVQVFALGGVAGVLIIAGVLNFVLLTAAASGTNSGIYAGSRMLFGLGESREGPRALEALSKRMIPLPAVLGLAIVCVVIALLLGIIPNAGEVYNTVSSMVSPLFLLVWGMIVAAYLVMCLRHGERHAASKFKSPGGVVVAALVLAMFLFNFVLGFCYPDALPGSLLACAYIVVLEIIYSLPPVRKHILAARALTD